MLYPAELRDRWTHLAMVRRGFEALAFTMLLAGVPRAEAAEHPCLWRPAKSVDGPIILAGVRTATGASVPYDVPDDARLHPTAKPDRYRRVPTFVSDAEGLAQERWLREGRALARPSDEPTACRKALLAAEAEARKARRGLWRTFRIDRAADPTLAKRVQRFAIVEGRVRSVGDRTHALYLNFGANWSEDLTVFLRKRDLRRHADLLEILRGSEGRRVRVRGWLEARNGAFMRVRDAGQIEFLDGSGS